MSGGSSLTFALLSLFLTLAFGGARWVASCNQSPTNILTSDDGVSWSSAPVANRFTGDAKAVAFGTTAGGRFVMTGNPCSSTIWSGDGYNWTIVTAPDAPGCDVGFALAFSQIQSRWVLGGSAATSADVLWYSGDGVQWSRGVHVTSTFGNQVRGVAYSDVQDRWVAVGISGPSPTTTPIAMSQDGISWQPVAFKNMFGTLPAADLGLSVVFAPIQHLWIAVGGVDSEPTTIYTSADSLTWRAAFGTPGTTLFSTAGLGVAVGGSPAVAIAVGQAVRILRASNVTHGWETSMDGTFPFPPTSVLFSPDDELWTIAGGNSTSVSKLAYSRDNGRSWVNANINVPGSLDDCLSVAFRTASVFVVPSGPFFGVVGPSFIPENVTASVAGTVVVNGDLTAAGSLVLSASADLTVQGNFAISSQLNIVQGAIISVNGSFGISAMNSSLVVVVPASVTLIGTVTVPVASFIDSSGSFKSVSATIADASCQITSIQPVTTSSTLSVSLQVACTAALTTGQIVGIAIGATAAAVLLVLCVVLLTYCARKRRDADANQALRGKEIVELSNSAVK